MFRVRKGVLQVYLAHPGGPWYWHRPTLSWTVPKGEKEDSETDLLAVAKREFEEETQIAPQDNAKFIYLGICTLRDGKIVHCWAFRKNYTGGFLGSNTFHMTYRSLKPTKIYKSNT